MTLERGQCYISMETYGLEMGKKTRTDFSWNILPIPEHISIFVKMGHIHVDPVEE